jgi:Fic family protein
MSWPSLDYERVWWAPQQGTSPRDRRGGPYRAAIPAEIGDKDPALPTSTNALMEEASVAIARFDAEMGGEVAPFGAVLLRSESSSSSEIEQLTASAKAIALAELGDTSKRNATAIVANTRAMQAAVDLSDRLDGESILAMHRALLGDSDPRVPGGVWRTEPVWIGGGSTPHTATFVPPRYELIPDAIADLERFVDRDDIPVLTQAAVAHAQFETIHPFPDGNGRTGRALLHSMLRGKGLTQNVTVPISGGLLVSPERYFSALTAYREGDIEPIARVIAEASFSAVANGRRLVRGLREIRANWREILPARRGSASRRILDELAKQPVMDTAFVQRELRISASAAQRAFADLESAGIVREFSGMRRNRCWRSDEVLAELDAFATRAGKRSSPWTD